MSTLKRLEERGVSAPAVLRRAGLPLSLQQEDRVLLSTEELFAFWRAVGELSANPTIGALLGTESKVERFSTTRLAALSCDNFRAAIDHMARFKRLTCPEEIVQKKKGGEWSIQFRWLLANEVEPPVLIECAFAWVLSIARVGTGVRISPLRVEFVEPRARRRT